MVMTTDQPIDQKYQNRLGLVVGKGRASLKKFLTGKDWTTLDCVGKAISSEIADERYTISGNDPCVASRKRATLGRSYLVEELIRQFLGNEEAEIRGVAEGREMRLEQVPALADPLGGRQPEQEPCPPAAITAAVASQAAGTPNARTEDQQSAAMADLSSSVGEDGSASVAKAEEHTDDIERSMSAASISQPEVIGVTTIPGGEESSTPLADANTAELTAHPLASIFPLLDNAQFTALKSNIRDHGLLEPIWLHQGQILDGRNRYRACKALGITPAIKEWAGECGSLLAFVTAMNLQRRNLTDSQSAMVGARLVPLFAEDARQRMLAGQKADPPANLQEGEASTIAAKLVHVSPRSVASARKVLLDGIPDLIDLVDAHEVRVSAAAILAELPMQEQQRAVAGGKEGVALRVKEIRNRKAQARQGRSDKFDGHDLESAMLPDDPADTVARCEGAKSGEGKNEQQPANGCTPVTLASTRPEDVVAFLLDQMTLKSTEGVLRRALDMVEEALWDQSARDLPGQRYLWPNRVEECRRIGAGSSQFINGSDDPVPVGRVSRPSAN